MYSCVFSKPPPGALEREKNDTVKLHVQQNKRYSNHLLDAIDWTLKLDHRDRPQCVDDFLQLALDGTPDQMIDDILDGMLKRTAGASA